MQQFNKHTRILLLLTVSLLSLAVSYAPVPFLNLHCKKVQQTHKQQNYFFQNNPVQDHEESQPLTQTTCSTTTVYFSQVAQKSEPFFFAAPVKDFKPFQEQLNPQNYGKIPDNPPQA
jgi:cytochrome c oxidase assembly protein Cox11